MVKISVKLCNIKKTAPAKKFDVSKISPTHAIEVKNRFELLDTAEKTPDELWQEIQTIILEKAVKQIPYRKPVKCCKWLSSETMRIAEQRKAAKAAGKREESRKLNSDFQRAVRKDNEVYWDQRCKQLEQDYMKGHTRNAFAQVKRTRTQFMARKGIIKNK
ncbi:hypothetical protein JGB54_23665 [Salmonella enterica subsp. enterica serovar Agona]|nr:hypothetical protein [Salmonella enterica subsp. enterica serovar Agona]